MQFMNRNVKILSRCLSTGQDDTENRDKAYYISPGDTCNEVQYKGVKLLSCTLCSHMKCATSLLTN